MFPRLRLKTKLVLAISGMVVLLVTVLSSIYIAELVRQRVDEAHQRAEFVALQTFHTAREALEVAPPAAEGTPALPPPSPTESLQTSAGLNSLLQAIVGYSPTIYDVAIADTANRAIVHTDAQLIGSILPPREDFATVVKGSFWKRLRVIYGEPAVYEVRIEMRRGDQPFGDVRVGLSTVFLKGALAPQLRSALIFSGVVIVASLLLAAGLSNLALRPLAAIGRRLDMLTGTQPVPEPPAPERELDEVGAVTRKIDRLGRRMQDVQDVFSALKENLDQIMANLEDGLMLFTRDSRAVLVSAAAERFIGKPRGEMLGSDIGQIFSEETPLGRLMFNAFGFQEAVDQQEVEAPTGRRISVSVDFIQEHGERIGALVTLRDAESVRTIENEIELSRRLAAIGRLTSGVAHEVKNPINAIVVHLELLRQKSQGIDADTRRHMDVIGSEIQRLDRVVQTLVDFTRPMELRLADVDMRHVVEDVVQLAGPDAGRQRVSISTALAPDPLPVKVDTDLVKQALLNIVINGVQAMPDGGQLVLSARRLDDDVEVEVADQGSGIPAALRDKVFNLYFTTKATGSGIGLAMSYRVMQLHNGSIEFESHEGRGTTFRLRFPAVPDARAGSPSEMAAQT